MSTYQIYENGLDKFDNLLKKKKGCLFEETFCSIRFFDVTEKEKNSNKSSWYISETYLKGNCQADGYEVIVENYEGQEWHSKVLCLFTYQRVTIFNAVPSNIVFDFLQQYYNHSTQNFKHFPRFKFSYANSSHSCVNQCFNIDLLQPYLPFILIKVNTLKTKEMVQYESVVAFFISTHCS